MRLRDSELKLTLTIKSTHSIVMQVLAINLAREGKPMRVILPEMTLAIEIKE